jgi:hypothetical protein
MYVKYEGHSLVKKHVKKLLSENITTMAIGIGALTVASLLFRYATKK